MKKWISFLFLGIFLTLTFNCNKSEELNIDVDAEIIKEMQDIRIPSVAACIVNQDGIVWEGTYGHANVGSSEPPDRFSLYTIMSISKLFLSTTVMQLWERGLINLDADINEYLPFTVRNPQFPEKIITPHMLLNHTSGFAWPEAQDFIPDFHHFYSAEEPPLLIDWLPEYILPGGAQYRSTVWKEYAPGTKSLYSNIGTSLLALIVEQISGMDYRDFCRENILIPLEMNNSAFRLGNLNQELLVTPYADNNAAMAYYTCRHYPVGFLSSNIEDFSHFMMAFLNDGVYNGKRILEKNTMDKMFELQNPQSGASNLWANYLGDSIGHLGGGTGFSTWAEWHLTGGTGLFIFSNKVNAAIDPGGRIYELVRYQANKY